MIAYDVHIKLDQRCLQKESGELWVVLAVATMEEQDDAEEEGGRRSVVFISTFLRIDWL